MNIVIRTRKISYRINLLVVYTVIIAVCYILPGIKYRVPYIPEAIALLMTYVFYIRAERRITKLLSSVLWCSGWLMGVAFFVMYRWEAVSAINEFIRAVRFFAPAFLYLLLWKEQERNPHSKNMKYVFVVLSGVFLYVAAKTIQQINQDPMVARILASGELDEYRQNLRFQNIGGFEFSYALGFVVFFTFAMVIVEKRLWGKLLWLVLSVIGFYYIFRVQYGILLWMTVLGCCLISYRETSNGIWKTMMLLGMVIATVFIGEILGFLQGFAGEMLKEKMGEILAWINGDGISVLGSRPRLYREAFLRFWHSPIWGQPASIGGVAVPGMIENHSTLLAYLQGMGVLGTFALYYPIFCSKNAILDTFSRGKKGAIFYRVVILMFLILSMLNPIHYCFEISFVIFLYIPCGIQTFMF